MPDSRPPAPTDGHAGLGPAIIISLGLHVLVGLVVWHGLIGKGNEDRDTVPIIDTRVKSPALEVEVYLSLLDSPAPKKKKESPHPVASVQNLQTKPELTDPSKSSGNLETSVAAGAESSKPRKSRPDSPLFAGASKTQPRPREGRPLVPTSQGEYFVSGSGNEANAGNGRTSFFHIGARAKSIVFVIDRSVSMGPSGGLARAKKELIETLSGMANQTLFQIIIFNRSVELLSAGLSLLPATKENKQRAAEFLALIQPEGGTMPVPALKRALALRPEVIFFLSDGGDWTDRQVQEVISANRGHSLIHVVDFGGVARDQINGPLRVLASKNRGEYRAISMNDKEPEQIHGN